MGASYRWADWLAAGAPSPIRRRLLRVYGFDNANSWKARQNPARPKTQHETHIRPATPSRRRTKNHVPRVSPCSPASIDQGFVEIGHAQLSQSVKTTNVTHTYTQTSKIMAPCTHPGTSREVREPRLPRTCSRPCAFEVKKTKKKNTKSHQTLKNTPRNISTAARRPRPPRDGVQ